MFARSKTLKFNTCEVLHKFFLINILKKKLNVNPKKKISTRYFINFATSLKKFYQKVRLIFNEYRTIYKTLLILYSPVKKLFLQSIFYILL